MCPACSSGCADFFGANRFVERDGSPVDVELTKMKSESGARVPFRLDGKTVLVTGCGAIGPGWGNGKAISVLFARQGAQVFGVDINRDAADETFRIIASEGGCMAVSAGNVTHAADAAAVVSACLERF